MTSEPLDQTLNPDKSSDPIPPHSHALRLHRANRGCFFVTKAIQPRKQILDDTASEIICSAWLRYMDAMQILLTAFVVMPDHYHILFSPIDGYSISKRMNIASNWIQKQTRPLLKQHDCKWQDGFHESRVRSSRQFHAIRHYINENPVTAGLAKEPQAWPWSSANLKYSSSMALPWPWRFEQDE